MAVNINKRLLALGICIASKHFLSIITEWESDSDSDNDEVFVRELIDMEENVRIRGKRKKVIRIEGFVEEVISRFTGKQFKEHFRIKSTIFDNLENRLGNLLLNQHATGRSTISIRTQLLASLWLLATPDSYRSVATKFDLGKSSLSHCVRRVVKVLCSISAEVISWPKNDCLINTKAKFKKIAGMSDIIGAIDGSFIEIPAPKIDPEVYNTRKCRHAIVLQAVCDADLKFIDCFAGYPGSVGDLRVFRNSDLWHAVQRNKNKFFPEQEFIIGDKAYPVLEWCLPPYKDNGHLTMVQKNFNTRLSQARQVIERAFALLKGRFRRLKYLHMSRIDLIPKTILACCVLHNICLDGINIENDEDIQNYILEGQINNEANEINIQNNHIDLNTESDILGIDKRNYIAQTLYMLNQNDDTRVCN